MVIFAFIMRAVILSIVALASSAFAQNCGPAYANQNCEAGKCCEYALIGATIVDASNISCRQPVWLGTSSISCFLLL